MTFLVRFLISCATVFYVFTCLLLVLIILVQKGKSSMGFGHLGGASQLLFGGSGGQDLLQKTTWVLGAIFIFGSLGLAILKTRQSRESRFVPAITSAAPITSAPTAIPEE